MAKKQFVTTAVHILLSGLVAGSLVIGYQFLVRQLDQTSAPGQPHQAGQPAPGLPDSPEAQRDGSQPAFTGQSAQAAPATTIEQQIVGLYRQVSPSVVNITTRSMDYNSFYEPVPRAGAGSGFVLDKAGHVLTNFHVVEGAQRYMVTFGNVEQSFPAKLIGIDPRGDLAVLRVQAPQALLRPVKLGDSARMQIGQTAIAIGNPFGIGQTITTGVVSSLGRKIRVDERKVMSDMIQTDAAINMGNSGGPLFNLAGEVIGINTVILSPSGGSIGLGFAIPSNIAKRFIPDLIKYGQVQYPWMGVSVLPLTPNIAKTLQLPVGAGLLVLQTFPGGSAHQSGLRGGTKRVYVGNYVLYLGGDIIIGIDGQPVRSEDDLTEYLERRKQVGDKVTLTLVRDGQKINVPVTLTARKR